MDPVRRQIASNDHQVYQQSHLNLNRILNWLSIKGHLHLSLSPFSMRSSNCFKIQAKRLKKWKSLRSCQTFDKFCEILSSIFLEKAKVFLFMWTLSSAIKECTSSWLFLWIREYWGAKRLYSFLLIWKLKNLPRNIIAKY